MAIGESPEGASLSDRVSGLQCPSRRRSSPEDLLRGGVMRKTLLCGSVALAAAVSLAILDAAQHTRTPTPTLNHGPTEALAPAANSDIGSPTSAGSCANEGWR